MGWKWAWKLRFWLILFKNWDINLIRCSSGVLGSIDSAGLKIAHQLLVPLKGIEYLQLLVQLFKGAVDGEDFRAEAEEA
jgi:hypothetical protein